jgi:hypothetical protein
MDGINFASGTHIMAIHIYHPRCKTGGKTLPEVQYATRLNASRKYMYSKQDTKLFRTYSGE